MAGYIAFRKIKTKLKILVVTTCLVPLKVLLLGMCSVITTHKRHEALVDLQAINRPIIHLLIALVLPLIASCQGKGIGVLKAFIFLGLFP